MGTLIGFLLGYVLGVKAGPDSYEELQEAWRTIASSDEMKGLLSGALAVARDLARQGASIVASRIDDSERPLREVA